MRLRGIVLAVLLAGCASTQQQQADKMSAVLSPYIGQPIANPIAAKGPPTNTFDLSPGKKMFQWQLTQQSASAVVPIGGSFVAVPSQTMVCTVSFTASTNKANPSLSDWIVESYTWNGAC
jgi:hypothetical protein